LTLRAGRLAFNGHKRRPPNMNHLETLGEILAILMILAMGALLLAL
jgi:hypothetical protein